MVRTQSNIAWKNWTRLGLIIAAAAAARVAPVSGAIVPNGQYTPGTWTSITNVVVGSTGYGDVTVNNGYILTVNSFTLGDLATGVGFATITGTNTKLTVTGSIYSGDAGYGSFRIENGASVTANMLQASVTKEDNQSAGIVAVKGAGSTLNINGNGFISPGGNGLLSVTQGGQAIFGGTLNFSYYNNSVSSLVLSDAGSKIFADTISTGYGQSDLDIYSGSTLSVNTANIGLSGGKTNITVGTGAVWNSVNTNIGGNNTVDFQIVSGATGNLGTVIADGSTSYTPNLTVSGTGSKLNYSTMVIGEDNGGKFTSSDGAVAAGGDVIIGKNTNSKGTAQIDGGSLKAGNITLGQEASSNGTLTVSNGGAVTGNKLVVGSKGKGTFNNNGGQVTVNTVVLGDLSGSTGYMNLIGNTAKVNATTTTIGNTGSGLVMLTNGSTFNAGNASIGSVSGYGDLDAAGGYFYANNLSVGRTSIGSVTGYVTIENGGAVRASSLNLNATSSLIMYDGTLAFDDLFVHSTADVNFYAGRIEWTGDHQFAANSYVNRFFNNTSKVNVGQEFRITGKADFKTPFEIDGGTLSVGTMGMGKIQFTRGTFAVLDDGFNVETGAVFGNTLNIRSDTLYKAQFINNKGLITGNGDAIASIINTASGRIQVGLGNRLHFGDGSDYGGHSNSGLIELNGGTIHFDGTLQNYASGTIKGYGTLQVDNQYDNQGLTNQGKIYLTGNAGIIGNVNNTNLIALSGTSPNVFYNNVKNNGEIRVSEGSQAIFLGVYSGAGQITGGGKTFFEGGLNPGNSPAKMQVDGNVKLGSGSTLDIEIGGLLAGSQHDKIEVTGNLELGGTLHISLYDLGSGVFNPQLGDSFDILDWGTLTGTFSNIQLTPLSAGLGWDISQLYTTGVISVGSGSAVPEPASLAVLALGGFGLMARRSKRA